MKLSTYFSLLNRRQWLKVLVLGTVSNTALGRTRAPAKRRRLKAATAPVTARSPLPVANVSAPGVAPAPATPGLVATQLAPSNNLSAILPIHLSQFPGLDQPGGSIAIFFSNLRNPIVINRAEADVFHALDSTCTHQGCQVGNFNPNAFYMECDCHGSLYTIDGRVAQGPAQFDLATYRTRFDGADLLEIELDGVPLRIDRVSMQSQNGASTRLRLDFPGTAGCKYQVQYYPTLAASAQPALFALSAGGPANQSAFTVPDYSPFNPLSGSGPKTVWVDAAGSTGFFTIEIALGLSTPL